MKLSFHCWLVTVRVLRGVRTNEDTIPDAPRISPEKRRRVAADRPMRDPPNRPDTGVKALILLDLLYCAVSMSIVCCFGCGYEEVRGWWWTGHDA